MTYTIRPFNPIQEEYEILVDLHNAYWPDRPDVARDWQMADERLNPKYLFQRYVFEQDGNIVAFGQASESPWAYVEGQYHLEFHVHPAYLGQGIKQRLYDHINQLLQQRTPKPIIYAAYTREDKEELVAFLKSLGFVIVQREAVSEIDLEGFDPSPFASHVERAQNNGIVIYTLAELMKSCSDWRQRNYDLFMAIINEIPVPDAPTPQPIDEFYRVYDHPNYIPDGWFIALDGDEWVGNSSMWKVSGQDDRLDVNVTGVLPSHRRKGIATALKLKTFEYAQRHGVRYIKTGNEENNPMYALNLMLGFKPKPGWLTFRKEL